MICSDIIQQLLAGVLSLQGSSLNWTKKLNWTPVFMSEKPWLDENLIVQERVGIANFYWCFEVFENSLSCIY